MEKIIIVVGMLNEDLVKGRPPKKTEIFMTDVARDYLGNKKHISIVGKNAIDYGNQDITFMVRGLARGKIIHEFNRTNSNYYYIDTGYLMAPAKKKLAAGPGRRNSIHKAYHRMVYNGLQNLTPLSPHQIKNRINRYTEIQPNCTRGVSYDNLVRRFKLHTGQSMKHYTIDQAKRGNRVLIVPPSDKVCGHYNIDVDSWIEKTKIDILENWKGKAPQIDVRYKAPRRDRVQYSFMDQLHEGHYWCTVTYNSIAAVESVMCGIPCVCTLGENAGTSLCERSYENINNPFTPTNKQVQELLFYLSTCQFTPAELASDFCYDMVDIIQTEKYV